MFVQKKRLPKTLLLLAVMVGCGGRYDASVTGIVTLDDEIVPAGAISFIPVEKGPPAYARTDESGEYEVFTGNEAGLKPGQYGVTIVARHPPKENRSALGGPPPPGERITPQWYGSSRLSPLIYTVESGSNEINLELTSEPPPGWGPPKKNRRRR